MAHISICSDKIKHSIFEKNDQGDEEWIIYNNVEQKSVGNQLSHY